MGIGPEPLDMGRFSFENECLDKFVQHVMYIYYIIYIYILFLDCLILTITYLLIPMDPRIRCSECT